VSQSEANALTLRHTVLQMALSTQAKKVFTTKVWPMLDSSNLSASFPRYAKAANATVGVYRQASSTMAQGYLAQHSSMAGQNLTIVQAPPLAAGRVDAAMAVTGPIAMKQAISGGRSVLEAREYAYTRATGAMDTLVQGGGRQTILDTARRNDIRWARVSDGSPCSFCAMLVSRGAAYVSDATSEFRAHERCGCSAEPVYTRDGDPFSGEWSGKEFAERVREIWDATTDGTFSGPNFRNPGASGRAYRVSGKLQQFRSVWDQMQAAGLAPRPPIDLVNLPTIAPVLEADGLGFLPRDKWPDWAKDGDLESLLARLPDDRESIGMLDVGAKTARDAQLDWMAQNLGYEDRYELMDRWRELSPDALGDLKGALDRWNGRLAERLQRAGMDPDQWSAADRKAIEAFQRSSNTAQTQYDEAARVAWVRDHFDTLLDPANRSREALYWRAPDEWIQKRLGTERYVPAFDLNGNPKGPFRDQIEVLDRIGDLAEAEIRKRWAATSKEPFPMDYYKLLEDYKAYEQKLVKIFDKMADAEYAGNQALVERLSREAQRLQMPEPVVPSNAALAKVAALSRDVIGEVRLMANRETAMKILRPAESTELLSFHPDYGLARRVSNDILEMHYDGVQHFPQRWASALERAVGDRPYRIAQTDRGYNGFPQRQMAVSGRDPERLMAVTVHEIGHGMENAMPHLTRLEFALLMSRARRGDDNRPTTAPLGRGYGQDEYHLESTFRHPYTAKSYFDPELPQVQQFRFAHRDGKKTMFEVFTTGTQIVFPRDASDLRFTDGRFRRSVLGWMIGL
jgi:ferredoxin